MTGPKSGDEKKSSTTVCQPLTRSRARKVKGQKENDENLVPSRTKRRQYPHITTTEETDAPRDGVLKERNGGSARKKTTAAMRRQRGTFLDTCKSFLPGLDQKYKNEPQYVTGVAPHIDDHFKKLEPKLLTGNGGVLKAMKYYPDFRDYRTRVVNWLFSKGYNLHAPSNTIHLAVYYVDRFLETYSGPDVNSTTVAVMALHLASKFEDVEALYLDQMLRQIGLRTLKESDVLSLEAEFFGDLMHFVGLTTTHFASRYLHAIDRETIPAEGYTARYLCALSVCHFPFTGHLYSKIATAAVFIAYNKYRDDENSESKIVYPKALEIESGYKLSDIEEVVLEMVQLVKSTEIMAATPTRKLPTEMGFYTVFKRYATVGVATGHTLPDFKSFFKNQKNIVCNSEPYEDNEEEAAPVEVLVAKKTDSTDRLKETDQQSATEEETVEFKDTVRSYDAESDVSDSDDSKEN
eukprot:g744.t1